nr:hypothetical protein BaRGS_014561 [Batillaria attramentaria]
MDAESGRQRAMVCLNLTEKENNTLGGEKAQALFEEVSHVIYGFLLPIVCAFGIVGNLLNLTILTRRKLQKSFRTLEQAANLCLISLAVSDLMFCVFAFPTMFLPKNDLYQSKGLLLTYRVYSTAVINVFIMISTWLTVAMSLERYLAICHPLRQDLYLTTRRIKIVIVLTYILSFIFNIPVLWRYEVQEICPRPALEVNSSGLDHDLFATNGNGGDRHTLPGDINDLVHAMNSSVFHNFTRMAFSRNATGGNRTGTAHANLPNALRANGSVPVVVATATTPAAETTSWDWFGEGSIAFRPNPVSLWDSAQLDTIYRIMWAVVNNMIPLILLIYFNVCLCRKIYRSYKMRQKFKQAVSPSSISSSPSFAFFPFFFYFVFFFCFFSSYFFYFFFYFFFFRGARVVEW